jgi:hypothetical protein
MSEVTTHDIPEFRSACEGGTCVEVSMSVLVAVRDSKHPDGPVLTFTQKEWSEFVQGVKAGMFDIR